MCQNDIFADMKTMYDIQILYSKAHRALQYALSLTYGTYEETLKLLSSFGYMLEQQNPGTINDLQCNEDGRFLYFFMSLSASLIGFKRCMRPVIALDGTHLKGRFGVQCLLQLHKIGTNRCIQLLLGTVTQKTTFYESGFWIA
ncbi:hypothetical protein Ddye_028021 [Dipteronia dyeriana]|uniref:Uncharacterized protein n=1 Tax=Dipteronia dyeriana TaxID=168575 RepID=A0AAD9TQE2_9ROSI|nr:hypothetical protein Ddye_028021 [Dipteronia dyeriana]